MAANRTISIRMGLEGALELKQQLEGAGVTGGAALDKLRTGLEKLGAQDSSAVVAALDRITQAATRAQTAAGQAQANAFGGVDKGPDYRTYELAATHVADYGTELDRLRTKYSPLFAASKQYEATLNEIGQAEKVGAISAAEATAARDKITASFAAANAPTAAGSAALRGHAAALGSVTVSAGAAAAAQRNLSIQVIQAVSGIASGQPVLTTFIQQGHQVADSALAMGTGFGGVATAAKGMFNSLGGLPALLGVVVVGSLVALGAAAEHEATRLGNLRQQLRATQEGYEALALSVDATARRVAASSTLTTAEAREAAQTIASAKYFAGTSADIERLARLSADLARVWNTDVAKASGVLRDAINDPAAAAKKFAEQGLPQFTGELVRLVDRMQASGQGSEALRLVLDGLTRSTTGAAKDLSPLQKALHDLEQQFYGAKEGGNSLAVTLGTAITTPLASLVTHLTEVLRSLKEFDEHPIGALKTLSDLALIAVNPASAIGRLTAKAIGSALPSTGGPLVDASTGQAVQASAELLRQRPDVANQIYRIAEANGISPAIADLGTRVVFQESGGRQLDPKTGQTLTSSAGALGIGQLMPDTAAQYRVNPHDTDQNLLGMLRYLTDLSKDPRFPTAGDVAGAYNAGPAGYARARAAGKLPSETAAYIPAVVGSDAATRSLVQPASGLRADGRAADDGLSALAAGGLALSRQNVADEIAKIDAQMKRLRDSGRETTPEFAGLVENRNKLVAQDNQLISVQDKTLRGQLDQIAAGQGIYEGDRKLFALRQQLAQVDRDQGGAFSAAQRAAAENNLRQQALQQLAQQVGQIDLTIDANTKLAAAYGDSYAAVARTTAGSQAYAEALKLFPSKSEEARRATELLTQKILDQAAAAQLAKIAASTRDNAGQLAYINEEISLVGSSVAVRTRELAVFKARQDLEKSGIAVSEEAKAAYLASVAAVADGQSRLSRLNDAFTELQNIGTQAFDRIGSAITQAFTTGGLKAIDFGSIMKGVLSEIAQYLLKMAVLNPLLNALFGSNKSTISDVGGLLGNLLGGSSSIDTSSAFSFKVGGDAGNGLVYDSQGNGVDRGDFQSFDTAAIGQTGTLGANGGVSLSTVASTGLTAIKGLDFLAGGKLLDSAKGFVLDAVGYTPGQSLGAWVSSLVGEETAGVAAGTTGALGGAASEAAAEAGGAVAAGAAESAASVAGEAGVGLIGSAVSTIASAIPYIGAAITVITDIAQGNYRGAALVLGGAAIGTAILPGIGTAIGAALGTVVDLLLPSHPKNPFQDTEVDVTGGHITTGKVVSQLENTDSAQNSVTQFGQQLDAYMSKVGIVLTNADSAIGHLGNNIKGLDQVDSIDKLFNKLQFSGDPNDTSNFGVAKGALTGLKFDNIQGLNAELVKVARFADGMDQLGIKLASVGQDLTNISVASVSLTGALTDQKAVVNEDGSLASNPTAAGPTNPLRIALAHDLPGQNFADVAALSAEIDKVNQFVNGTIPGLLNPILKSTSALQSQIEATNQSYGQAIIQAEKYGLDTQTLIDAQTKADDLILAGGRKQLDQGLVGIQSRGIAAGGGSPAEKFQTTMANFQVQAEQQRDALIKSLTDVFSDSVKGTDYFFNQLSALNYTLVDEAKAQIAAFEKQQRTAGLTIQANIAGVRARAATLSGDARGAELINFDAKAAQERDTYSNSLLDFFGANYAATAEYQTRLSELEAVEQGERLGIIKKYSDQATATAQQAADAQAAAAKQVGDAAKQAADAASQAAAQVLTQAQGNVASLYTTFADYTRKLQVGSDSPLSPLDQYALAGRQFAAVAGAAAAGDYRSASQLTSYADALISSSRSVNGSGAAYATDVGRVVDALANTTAVTDALTASAQRQIAQEQTAAIVSAVDRLQDEIVALRREIAHQALAA